MASTIRPPAEESGCTEPSELLSIAVDQDGDTIVLSARGEIDLYTAPLLSSALREAIDGDAELVVVDLAEVTFMASSGLAALISGLDQAKRRRCELRLAGGGRAVQRPLQAAGLDGHFEHYPTAAEAVRQRVRSRFSLMITARMAQSPGTP
jgi:anti-sigma B factor antagonist